MTAIGPLGQVMWRLLLDNADVAPSSIQNSSIGSRPDALGLIHQYISV